MSKGGNDWTRRYPWIVETARKIRKTQFILDGEAVVLGVDGMAVRNLCRQRLSDDELAACCLFGDWDMCYTGVLAAIAATPVRTQVPVSRPQPRQLQFSFLETKF